MISEVTDLEVSPLDQPLETAAIHLHVLSLEGRRPPTCIGWTAAACAAAAAVCNGVMPQEA